MLAGPGQQLRQGHQPRLARNLTAMVHEPCPILEPLRDDAYFARVFLEFGAPTWPNGFDIAPEWLRREMAAAGELTRVAAE